MAKDETAAPRLRGLAIIALGAATAASASSPDSWAALDRRVTRDCAAASGLVHPVVSRQTIRTSDDIGVEIRRVSGRDRQGRRQQQLCVVRRSTGRTEVHEAPGWFAPGR